MTGDRNKKSSIKDMFFLIITLSIYIEIIELHTEVEV